jgi:hypothetical protein
MLIDYYIRKHVPGTIWTVVLTAGNKEFYYNTEEKTSTWTIPSELLVIVAELKEMQRRDDDSSEEEDARYVYLSEKGCCDLQ